jgi:hypothetical protein
MIVDVLVAKTTARGCLLCPVDNFCSLPYTYTARIMSPLLLIAVLLILPFRYCSSFGVVLHKQLSTHYQRNNKFNYLTTMGASTSRNTLLSEETKLKFENKSILLTGASRGLGRSLAPSWQNVMYHFSSVVGETKMPCYK